MNKIYGRAKNSKEIGAYHCRYCNYKFQQYIGTYSSNSKHQNGSAQVKCPRCKNFLKTHEDRIE